MRAFFTLAFAIGFLSSQLAMADWDPEARHHLEEEANMNDQRARELDPIIARNQQARNSMQGDADQLANQARGMRDRANWYRSWAQRPGVWHREHFEKQAHELDENAGRNDQMANAERDLVRGIDSLIQNLTNTRAWHIDVARRMRESLAWR